MAVTASSGEAKAVIMITPVSGRSCLLRASSSSPVMPGMRMSEMTRSKGSPSSRASALLPSAAARTP